jgi:energy-coupling factor transporter transmembrane protein EcfT
MRDETIGIMQTQSSAKFVLALCGSAILALILAFVFAAFSVGGVLSMSAANLFLWIALAIFAITLGAAAYLYLTEATRLKRIFVSLLVVVFISTTFFIRAALFNWMTAKKLEDQAANSQTSVKGFMQIGKVWFNTKKIVPNDRIIMSMWIVNKGTQPIDNVYHFFSMKLIQVGPNEIIADRETHALFLAEALQLHAKMLNEGNRGMTVGKGEGIWDSMTIPGPPQPPLSQDVFDAIIRGDGRLYVYAWARWRDAPHDLDFCNWLQAPPNGDLDDSKLIWHSCAE